MSSLSPTSVRPRAEPQRHSHIGLVIVSAVIGVIAVGAVSYLLWPTWTPEGANDPSRLPVMIGKTLFNVPTDSVRMKVQRRSGPQDRVDLDFAYPSLAPGEVRKHYTVDTVDDGPRDIDEIFLSIAAHGGTLAPEDRARTIYPRYLDTGVSRTDDGLVMQPFRGNSPYANEDLVAATAPALVARCTRDGATPGMCLSERRIDGADLTFRFPRSWLTQWRDVADAMDRIVAQIYKPR